MFCLKALVTLKRQFWALNLLVQIFRSHFKKKGQKSNGKYFLNWLVCQKRYFLQLYWPQYLGTVGEYCTYWYLGTYLASNFEPLTHFNLWNRYLKTLKVINKCLTVLRFLNNISNLQHTYPYLDYRFRTSN